MPFGGLDSFLVRGGTVTINGAGLDASKRTMPPFWRALCNSMRPSMRAT
jgi:hypothetical protein